mmetsp:Transcript_34930/g.68614  ORF Transcript_34930/g.68614 Transcript_34930/m.68614 type:complete len:120 (-) Transcript_34930:342-701(-)
MMDGGGNARRDWQARRAAIRHKDDDFFARNSSSQPPSLQMKMLGVLPGRVLDPLTPVGAPDVPYGTDISPSKLTPPFYVSPPDSVARKQQQQQQQQPLTRKCNGLCTRANSKYGSCLRT